MDAPKQGYERQRQIFKWAIEAGWPGKEPSVLGEYVADQALKSAEEFLRSIAGELTDAD